MKNYYITKNETYNSLEVTFAEKPSAEVREALKALRFRWHGKAGIWYGYATEEATRAAIEGKEAPEAAEKPQKAASLPPFYFPAPVTDQAAGLPVGEVITIYQADGWTMQNHATTGKLLSATPGNYAQYSGVFLDTQTGKKAARIFCRDGKETVIFSGLPYRLPDAVKYESIKEGSTGARIGQYRDQADEMRHIIQFYGDMGRSPILDTVQR